MIRTISEVILLVVLVLFMVVAVKLRYYKESVTPFEEAKTSILNDDVSFLKTALTTNCSLVNLTDPWDQSTLLHIACASGWDVEIIRTLLDVGSDPNALDDCGRTPMHILCQRSPVADSMERQFAMLLFEYGADFSIKDAYGKEPLDYSVRKTWEDLLMVEDAAPNGR